MSEDAIVVYGTAWCGDCRRAKKLLERRGVEYAWVDVEEQKGASEEMLRLNGGDRRVPTVLFPDGTVLVEPSNAELGAKLDGRAA
ncbi:MAG TPA: glutaredoxin domain-containing protein [Rubrobacteraceae bacterium]|nr:glutaredoxin domain-containing protein [Rubrobacteraceae bacterium]